MYHNFNFKFQIGKVSGHISTETIYIKQSFIKNFQFLLVNNELNIDRLISDGVLGLNINEKEDASFITQLYKQKVIKSQKFSFYLSDSSRDSSFILDDISEIPFFKQIYKKMSFCPVKSDANSWECEMRSVDIDRKEILMNSKVSFDTGTSYIVIPAMNFMQIKPTFIDSVNTTCAYTELNQLVCKCLSPKIFPEIRLNINGNHLIINPLNIIDYEPSHEYQCRFQIIVSTDKFDYWILGDSALRGLLISFDLAKRTIGFTNTLSNFPVNINDEINKDQEDNQDVKIYYFFALVFILAGVVGLYKCANNENFFSKKPLNKNKETNEHLLLIEENSNEVYNKSNSENINAMINLNFKKIDFNENENKNLKKEENK